MCQFPYSNVQNQDSLLPSISSSWIVFLAVLYCTAELRVSSWHGTADNRKQGILHLALVLYWQESACVCVRARAQTHTHTHPKKQLAQVISQPVFRYQLQLSFAMSSGRWWGEGSRQMLSVMKGQATVSLWSVSANTVGGQPACWCGFLFFVFYPSSICFTLDDSVLLISHVFTFLTFCSI